MEQECESFDHYCEWWQTTGQYEAADALEAERQRRNEKACDEAWEEMFESTQQSFSALFGGRL